MKMHTEVDGDNDSRGVLVLARLDALRGQREMDRGCGSSGIFVLTWRHELSNVGGRRGRKRLKNGDRRRGRKKIVLI